MIGKIFSHYEILEHAGDNELGALYLARDLSRNATVRLLLLPLDLEVESRRACLGNLRIVAGLGGSSQDHLDQILDFGESESESGQLFIATPARQGERTLEEQLRPVAALPPVDACGIARQIAEGLVGLHEADLIHGFLRPGLILSSASGLVAIAYPGLGGCITYLRVKERCPAAFPYRAPEQLLGTAIDARADVWTLGVILYEMITRRLPFQAMSEREISKAIIELPHPRAWEGDRVHPELEKILDRALAKRPEERYQDTSEMLADLAAIERELIAAVPSSSVDATDRQRDQDAQGETLIGRTVSHFEIVDRIGGGGMGVVYRAKDIRLDRSVALKFLSWKSPQSDGKIQRFIQEAKAASALDHPNICTVHAIEETEDGTLFIAMALYEGETLTERITRGSLPASEIVDFGLQMCAGLSAAHGRGIIHRDIKPANLMVTRDGVVKILDFGLSKFSAEGSDTSRPSGPIMGTVDYMAPEVAQGKEATQQSDIWSLGVVLFEMATGRRPFAGGNPLSILFNIIHTEPKELEDTTILGIPIELGWIIRRALAKGLDKRYQDVEALRADLVALLPEGQAVRSSRLRRFWRARRGLAVAAAGLFLALTAAILWLAIRQPPVRTELVVDWVRSGEVYGSDTWMEEALSAIVAYDLEHSDVQLNVGTSTHPQKLVVESSFRALARLALDGDRLSVQVGVEDLRRSDVVHQIEEQGTAGELIDVAMRVAAALRDHMGLPDPESLEPPRPSSRDIRSVELEQILEQARQELLLRNASAARTFLVEAVELEPRDAMAHALLTESLAFLGDVRQSRIEIGRAVELAADLELEDRLFYRARSLEYEKKTTDSAAILRALRALDAGTPFQSADPEERFHQEIHLAFVLARDRQSDTALEILQGLAAQGYEDDPLVASIEAEAVRRQDASKLQVAARRAVDLAVQHSAPLLRARGLLLAAEAWRDLQHPDEAETALEEALAIHRQQADEFGEANVLTTLGNLLWDQKELTQAKHHWQLAEGIFARLGDDVMLGRIKGNKALVLNQQGDLAVAIDVYKEALELNRKSGDRAIEAMNLANMADPLMAMGRFSAARESCETALELVDRGGEDSSEKATVLTICAELHILTGNLAEADRLLQQAIQILRAVENTRQLSKEGVSLGRLRYYQGNNVASAISVYRQSLQAEVDHLTPVQGKLHWGLGTALRAQGQLEEARTELEQALRIQKAEPLRLAEAQLSLAEIALDEEQPEVAEDIVRGVLRDLQESGAVLEESRAHVLLARSFLDRDRLTVAQDHLERATLVLADIQSPIYRLPLEVTECRLWLALGETARANDKLEDMLTTETLHGGFHEWELEIRLALAEVELVTGQQSRACSRLLNLEKDATQKGFGLLVSKALRLRKNCN